MGGSKRGLKPQTPPDRNLLSTAPAVLLLCFSKRHMYERRLAENLGSEYIHTRCASWLSLLPTTLCACVLFFAAPENDLVSVHGRFCQRARPGSSLCPASNATSRESTPRIDTLVLKTVFVSSALKFDFPVREDSWREI